MRWQVKAAVQSAFSLMPFGEKLNNFCQVHITKSRPRDKDSHQGILEEALAHLNAVRPWLQKPVEAATFYEFEAGPDLAMQVFFWALGVDRQVAIDILPMARRSYVDNTLRIVAELAAELALPRAPMNGLGGARDPLDRMMLSYGIRYVAPCDARATGLHGGSVDVVTSVSTLEHIPEADVPMVLRECCRLMSAGGLARFVIDYQDHYSHADPRISAYNFMRFADRAWALLSPALQYHNRLRHSDYLRMIREAGLEVIEDDAVGGDENDLAALRAVPLAPRFRAYPIETLAKRVGYLLVRKPAVPGEPPSASQMISSRPIGF